MRNQILLCAFLLLVVGTGYGQSSKKKNKKKHKKSTPERTVPQLQRQSNSYAPDPYTPEQKKEVVSPATTRKSKKKKSAYQARHITMAQKVEEFRDRMKANAKAQRKKEKKMKKRQYSDPSYFGHKRKPKIRKLKNRRLCRECGITH